MVVRNCQLQADEKRFDSADDEKDQSGQHVENGDALVINGGKPRELDSVRAWPDRGLPLGTLR